MDQNKFNLQQNSLKNKTKSFLSDESDHDASHVKDHKESHLNHESTNELDSSTNVQNTPDTNSTDFDKYVETFDSPVSKETVHNDEPQSLNLSELRKDEIQSSPIQSQIINEPVSHQIQQLPQSQILPEQLQTPIAYNPVAQNNTPLFEETATHPKNEIHVGDRIPKEKRDIPGCGFIKSVFSKIYNCIGCLLLILSIAIVLVVYLLNS